MGFEGEAYAETDETDETDAYGGRRDSSFLRRYLDEATKSNQKTPKVPQNPKKYRLEYLARLAHSSAHSSSPPCPKPFLTFPRFPL